MDLDKIFQSKIFKIVIWAAAGLVIFLFIFKIGMIVGFQKAGFTYKWGENYHRNFAGPRGGFFKGFGFNAEKDFIDAHGVFGQIIKIDGPTLVVKGRDGVEKIVLVQEKTVIRRFRDDIKITDLKVDDPIVVIGEPNNSGQIEAKLIRVMPPPMIPFNKPIPPMSWR